MREDPGGGFFEFVVKRALKQDQIVHLEGKLQFFLYFKSFFLVFQGNKFSFFGCYVCSETILGAEGPTLPFVSAPVSGVDLKIDTTCKEGLTKLVPDFDNVKCTNEKP